MVSNHLRQIKILSITTKGTWHGLYIYQKHIEALVNSTQEKIRFKFSRAFLDPGFFSLQKEHQKKVPLSHAILAPGETDIIHLQYDTESFFYNQSAVGILKGHLRLARFLAFNKKPFIVTVHGLFDDAKKYGLFRQLLLISFILPIVLLPSTTLVFHSQSEIDQLNKIFPMFKQKFIYTPHLLYPELVPIKQKKFTGKTEFGTLGNIGEWKGQLEILKIIKVLSSTHKNFHYTIAGHQIHTEYAQACLAYIQTNRLEKVVTFVNRFLSDREFAEYLGKIDIYLSYHTRSLHSSSGTIAHAIAAGKTVVGTDAPYNHNTDLNASVIRASTPEEYLDILKSLLAHPHQSHVLTQNYLKKINQAVAKKYLDLYTRS